MAHSRGNQEVMARCISWIPAPSSQCAGHLRGGRNPHRRDDDGRAPTNRWFRSERFNRIQIPSQHSCPLIPNHPMTQV